MATISPVAVPKALRGAGYPADRDNLVTPAKDDGADSGLVEKLSRVGAHRFEGPDEVQKAVSGNG